MKNTILATLALGVTALTSCTYDTYQNRPGPPPRPGYNQPPGHGNQTAEAYRRGQNDGARDKRSHRRFDPSRGQNSVNPPFRDSYRSGYAAGYRSAH